MLPATNQQLKSLIGLFLSTCEAADYGILILDYNDEIVNFNQQLTNIWQMSYAPLVEKDGNKFLGLILNQLAEPCVCQLKTQNLQSQLKKCTLLKLKNGKTLECYYQTQPLEGKNVISVWGFREVTARGAITQNKAQEDTLTKLPKRTIVTCQLSEAIAKAKSSSRMLGIILADLDRFKLINDTLGHQAGDRLIQQAVKRLNQCIREEDVIARWGGDEFALLLPQINSQADVSAIANRILSALQPPYNLENRPVHITSSMGIAIYPEHGEDAETLLKNADAALSQAKRQGRNNYQYYNLTFNSHSQKLLTLESLLHSALEREEFLLYYQPIVNIFTGKIVKMEALLRWHNPQLGIVAPCDFIPLAEENGTIIPIGEWVLKTACAQNKLWQTMGLSPIQMSVNLSVRQFQQPNLVSMIRDTLEQTQLHPSYLELEITESITLHDTQFAKATLMQLNQMGINLSMDDFGTGYSSLSYLKQFPFDTLKIDRSFIQDLHSASSDLAIVNAIITLGKGLDLNVVAEGVETEDLKDLLKKLNCQYIQGYLFSKPLPAAAATKLLQKYHF